MTVAQGIIGAGSDIRHRCGVRNSEEGFIEMKPRRASDPMRLYSLVLKELDQYLLMRNLTYVSGQRELLTEAVEAILQAVPGTVTAIPFQPGLGKSTLIRALLAVFSREFAHNTLIAQEVGGVIVVVEKTAEAEELESLCNEAGSGRIIAKAISSPNDYNLAQGRCLNGSATSYQECLGRSCPDYTACPLVQASRQIHDTPVLIMLHARYQRYMEDMTDFLTWSDQSGQHQRTLLLVDELPALVEENILNLSSLNRFETDFSTGKPSYQPRARREKEILLANWNRGLRAPFFHLTSSMRNRSEAVGLVSRADLEAAGFTTDALRKLKAAITGYTGAEHHEATRLIDAVLSSQGACFAIGRETTLFFPRLREMHGPGQPAVFLFSGTTSLSPELFKNPDIRVLPDRNLESFQRLTIHIQRGDAFSSTKAGLSKKQNRAAVAAWLRHILPQLEHHRVLAVTYKSCAQVIWKDLADFRELLIPYINSAGHEQPFLPYYGGIQGSNLYREATCVICIGLNRFEPQDYVSHALALDFGRSHHSADLLESTGGRLDMDPYVMDMQDITLARDIVQLVFRSALRSHGGTQPIELWLLQPPCGVIRYLRDYFKDCRILDHGELPESCRAAVTINREYRGNMTSAGKLLEFVSTRCRGTPLTPEQIRAATGLSRQQFKEAKRNPSVREYFAAHFDVSGSGQTTVYYPKNDNRVLQMASNE